MANKYYALTSDSLNPHVYDIVPLGEIIRRNTLYTFSQDGVKNDLSTYSEINEKDYDRSFIQRLIKTHPVTLVLEFLDYHSFRFSEKNNFSNDFIEHIKYEILPNVKPEGVNNIIKDWIDRRSRQRLIHYLSSYDYKEMKENRKSRESVLHYKYIFAEVIGDQHNLDRFRTKIVFQRGLKREYLCYGNTSESIWKDFNENNSGYFTFDGYSIYQIEEMVQSPNSHAELILKKMEESKTASPNPTIMISGSNNNLIWGTIENSIITNTQQLSHSGHEDVASALKILAEAISQSKNLSDQEKEESLQNVEFLTEQASPNTIPKKGLIKSALNSIKNLLPPLGQLASFTGQNLTKALPTITEYFEKLHNIVF